MFQPLKLVFFILIKFLAIYILFIFLWQAISPFYLPIFHIFGNNVFGQLGEQGEVRFKALPQMQLTVNDKVDTKVIYANRRFTSNAPLGASLLSLQYTCYIPTVAIIALILVTPVGWTRKSWALLGGLISVHAFITASVLIHLLAGFNQSKALEVIVLSPFWEQALLAAHKVFVVEITPKFIIAIFIWMLVMLPYHGWQTLAAQFQLPITDFHSPKISSQIVSPPNWFVARFHANEVQLSWEVVAHAESYQIYRQTDTTLNLYQTTSENFFTEKIEQAGVYIYGIKAVSKDKITSHLSQTVRINFEKD